MNGLEDEKTSRGYKHFVPTALKEATMTSTLKTWIQSVRALTTNIRALIIFVALYAVLLLSFYLFISIREATVWQVLVTYLFLILVPAQFFFLNAAILDFARDSRFQWKQILRNTVKIVIVTVPILLVGWILWMLLDKVQLRYPAPLAPIVLTPGPARPQPIHWPTLILSTIRFLFFGIALPLATIHLWIEATVPDLSGVKAFFRRIGASMARAFSSESVFTYGLGLVLFALIPYAILFVPFTVQGTKTAFAVFVVRLVLAFLFTLFGWIVTLVTLVRSTRTTYEPAIVASPTAAEAPA